MTFLASGMAAKENSESKKQSAKKWKVKELLSSSESKGGNRNLLLNSQAEQAHWIKETTNNWDLWEYLSVFPMTTRTEPTGLMSVHLKTDCDANISPTTVDWG